MRHNDVIVNSWEDGEMDKSRQNFEEWFNEETGWETTEYPNREVVILLWQAWQYGRIALLEELQEGPHNDTN